MAQDTDTEGFQAAPLDEAGTTLHLSASAARNVTEDRLRALLRVEVRGDEPSAVQAEINDRMTQALERANAVSNLIVGTQSYRLYQNREDQRWYGSQSLSIDGTDPAAILSLAGELQAEGLAIGTLEYYLSPESADEMRDNLIAEAIAKLNERLGRVIDATKAGSGSWIEMSIDPRSIRPGPVARSAAFEASDAATPPVAAPGTTRIELQVSGTAKLVP
ncbi:MAG: SIMPL domain-containing protein [Geminicoccaceae bacterium]